MPSSTDKIEKTVVLPAPRSRVWRALTDAAQFSQWFGVTLVGRFAAGEPIRGPVTSPGYEHLTMEIWVERIEPERLFSFRWHPAAIDPSVDYSAEPTTLVTFVLEEVGQATRLTVVESGFDQIPAARRAKTIEMNTGGWTAQLVNIAKFLGPS